MIIENTFEDSFKKSFEMTDLKIENPKSQKEVN